MNFGVEMLRREREISRLRGIGQECILPIPAWVIPPCSRMNPLRPYNDVNNDEGFSHEGNDIAGHSNEHHVSLNVCDTANPEPHQDLEASTSNNSCSPSDLQF